MRIRPKSFKTKLWLYFMLFAALIFSVLWLLQTVFLQSFYNDMLIKNTRKAAERIAENSSNENITDIIDSITLDNSILVFVTDTNGSIIYSSDEYKGAHQKNRINGNRDIDLKDTADIDDVEQPDNIEQSDNGKMKNKHTGNYRNLPYGYEKFLAQLNETGDSPIEYSTNSIYVYGTYIDYYGTDNKAILYVSTTLDAVGSAVSIIRIQLAWVTVLSLIAGFIFAWFIAKSFDKPVAQLYVKANKLGENDYPKEFKKGFCTELDELSDKLDTTSDKLIESRNFQMELLANVSHDLRTPLTMIKGYAEIIKDTSWEDAEQCSADIAVIVRETDRLTNLVNEILEYSELKMGDNSDVFERLDLSALISKVCGSFEALYRHNDETIEKQIEDGIFVKGNSSRLERAVYNLIDNAFRHTDESRKVTVRLYSADNKARIDVIDHGNGIPEQEIEHIWDRYYTFRQRKGKGVSGLGLAIVKQTVEMHNGSCCAQSSEGMGSTFRIELDKY